MFGEGKGVTMIGENKIRVIKISKEALFEFIYVKFIDSQELYFDVDSLEVMDTFDIDFENGDFIFCVHKSEDENGSIIEFPKEIDLKKLLKDLPDTTNTMFGDGRYKEYSKEELIELSK